MSYQDLLGNVVMGALAALVVVGIGALIVLMVRELWRGRR